MNRFLKPEQALATFEWEPALVAASQTTHRSVGALVTHPGFPVTCCTDLVDPVGSRGLTILCQPAKMDTTDQFVLDDEAEDYVMVDNPIERMAEDAGDDGPETDAARLAQRAKQIAFGKNTPAYRNYIKLVPKCVTMGEGGLLGHTARHTHVTRVVAPASTRRYCNAEQSAAPQRCALAGTSASCGARMRTHPRPTST